MSDTRKMLQYEANKKSTGVAYLLWLFLGMLGAHRFYLGKTGLAVFILVLTILSGVTSFIGIGLVLIFVPGIWVLIDAFLIPGMAREYNNNLINMMNI